MAKGRGASIARLRADWSAIVGADLARTTRPDALIAGRGARGSGGKLLRLRVSGAAALEVQHMSGQLVERVNAYAGHKMIDDIRLVQGTIASAPPRPSLPKPSPETVSRMTSKVAEVKDSDLRQALARLGSRIATSRRGVLLGLLGASLFARTPRAQDMSVDKLLGVLPSDHVLGDRNAPNIIIDYFSFTCPHCANFNAAVLPGLRKEWIDTGKVKLVMRHFPSDSVATHAALIAEGAGDAKFYEAVDAIFRAQVDWLTVPDPEAELPKSLVGLGISPQQAAGFMSDDRLLNKVVLDVQTGQALKVKATPNLFINEQFYGNPAEGAGGISAILSQVSR
jgi:hypothetical protein